MVFSRKFRTLTRWRWLFRNFRSTAVTTNRTVIIYKISIKEAFIRHERLWLLRNFPRRLDRQNRFEKCVYVLYSRPERSWEPFRITLRERKNFHSRKGRGRAGLNYAPHCSHSPDSSNPIIKRTSRKDNIVSLKSYGTNIDTRVAENSQSRTNYATENFHSREAGREIACRTVIIALSSRYIRTITIRWYHYREIRLKKLNICYVTNLRESRAGFKLLQSIVLF